MHRIKHRHRYRWSLHYSLDPLINLTQVPTDLIIYRSEIYTFLLPQHLLFLSVLIIWPRLIQYYQIGRKSLRRIRLGSWSSVSIPKDLFHSSFLPISLSSLSHLSAGDPLTTNVTIFTPFKGEQRNVIIFFLLFSLSFHAHRESETENERKGDHHYFNGRRMVSNRNRIFCNIHSSFHSIKDQWRREETWASFHLFLLLFLPHSLTLLPVSIFSSWVRIRWFSDSEVLNLGDKEYAE